MIKLRYLTLDDKKSFLAAFNADWSGFIFAHYWETIAGEDFETFVKYVPEFAKGVHLPEGHVPCSFLFAFNEAGELVGRTSIRHDLTDHLRKIGGHIGYAVVPKYRRRGYATEILKESLNFIKLNFPELNKVLVTCDEQNIASKKTIEKNGGILEDIVVIPDSGRKMRYWINI
jgi:predicted acetyltransferase